MFTPEVMRALCTNKTLRCGVPMIKIDHELEKKLKMNKTSLESEDWKNIRGPKPWEDPDLLQGRNPEILKTKTTYGGYLGSLSQQAYEPQLPAPASRILFGLPGAS
ncbi:PREDICTED: cytochrome c oxidase assembly protein COX16 homolog, mitochondrial-like [Chinchilla lanigera]|uniref:cytochrome c oxidase assembly protein COX16 homolog, mitochondrial-like n=1 Tax=Chinchilla lanigera TaxID=34839 RepID=UPI000698E008|nr:PREDICTED: cytochrome c oxidase assembly protein COX16 homolog, mitochondrial-like [Chinchilla lanigera]